MNENSDALVGQESTARGWRGRIVSIAIVLIAVVMVVAVARIPKKEPALPEANIPPVNVVVQTIEPLAEFADTFTLSAVVEPEYVVRVAAEVAGRIERYGTRSHAVSWRGREIPAGSVLDEGEPIEAGAPIAYLNRELLQAAYDRAQAQSEYDRNEYDRIADLYKREVTSKAEYDDARAKRDISQATLEEEARNLERTEIVAPISGILNRFTAEVGEYAVAGQQIAEIVCIDRVKVVVEVPERDIHYLKLGDTAEIVVKNSKLVRFVGKITYLSELADPATRTTRIEITIDNPDHLMRSGQIISATLTRRIINDAIMIPLASVIPLENGRVTYVVMDGLAERREVELGLIYGHSVRILSGLSAGDKLIVAGHRYVGPGQPVTVVEQRDSIALRDSHTVSHSTSGKP